ncbi:antitoxin MazE [Enterobacter hormaechei]|nr:antitoxin MazE [Enterobacter hormaechei]
MPVQTVKKWGNTPAVRLHAAITSVSGINLEDQVNITAEKGRIIIEPAKPRFTHTLADMVAKMTPENNQELVDWGKPVGKEIW